MVQPARNNSSERDVFADLMAIRRNTMFPFEAAQQDTEPRQTEADLTSLKSVARGHGSGEVCISYLQIPVTDHSAVAALAEEFGIGENSRVAISVPAGSNRLVNAEPALALAQALLAATSAESIVVRARFDDSELENAKVPSSRPDLHPEYREFFSEAARAANGRFRIEPAVQPMNTSSYEVKLAMREAGPWDGTTHLILPTHSPTLAKRLLLAAQSERQFMMSEGRLPESLQVVVLGHQDHQDGSTRILERASLLFASVAERHFPRFMDDLALKRGVWGRLYGLAQSAKIAVLARKHR